MFPLVHLRLGSRSSSFAIAVFSTGCFARGRLSRQSHLSSRRFSAVTGTPDTSNLHMSSGSRTSRKEGQAPSIPRPSSSLIVINDKNEVLMVQRNPDSRSFAGAHVFPGGNFDSKQDKSFEMTGIRETFEETGVLLASRAKSDSRAHIPEITDEVLEEARKSIHSGKLLFSDFLSSHGLEPDVSSLHPFTEWITPPPVPRRFHARFYVTFLPLASALAGPTSGTHYHRLPTPDSPDPSSKGNSTEVLSAKFMHPREVLAAFEREELTLMPPQFYILATLRDIFVLDGPGSEDVSTPAQRERVLCLSHGPFGKMVINPRPLPSGSPDGKSILTYEGDESRGGKKGRLHRIVMKSMKIGSVPTQMTLQRNFNVFTDIEDLLSQQSKL